tara:strand:+ start:3083 stop:4525 length:1443 start_codon:yes stop_codon:yes gene_type:complete
MNINNIINVVSVFLLFIISFLVINSSIYNKEKKIELFHNENKVEFHNEDILKKCPRGCGFHDTYVPSCDLCTEDKTDYDKATLEEKADIDKYHIEGDKQEEYTLKLINEWRKINPLCRFVFTIPIYDRANNNVLDFKTINIHPYYQKILYSKFNETEDAENISKITEWINNTFNKEIMENPKNIYPFPELLSNWKYISNEPSEYIKNELDYIIRLKYNLFNNDITEQPEQVNSDVTSYPDYNTNKIDIFDIDDNYNIVSSTNRLNTKDELIKNINKPLINSYKYANKRWKLFNLNTDQDELPSIDDYIIKILENIKNGKGLHINDIICLTKLDRENGLKYLNKLKDILILQEIERKKKILEYLTYHKLSTNGYFQYTLKTSCKNNDNDNIYTEIKLNDKIDNSENLEIVQYNKFWPIFNRSADFVDINQNILNKEVQNTENTEDDENYDENTQVCYDNLCGGDITNGIECLFLSKLSKID